jgi:hypothetical protein
MPILFLYKIGEQENRKGLPGVGGLIPMEGRLGEEIV